MQNRSLDGRAEQTSPLVICGNERRRVRGGLVVVSSAEGLKSDEGVLESADDEGEDKLADLRGSKRF
jgi:hypothetical protein